MSLATLIAPQASEAGLFISALCPFCEWEGPERERTGGWAKPRNTSWPSFQSYGGPAWGCSSCLYLIIPRAVGPRQDPSYLIIEAALIVGECFLMSCQDLPPHVFSPLFFMVSLEQHGLTQLPLPSNSPSDSWSQLSWLPLDTAVSKQNSLNFPIRS